MSNKLFLLVMIALIAGCANTNTSYTAVIKTNDGQSIFYVGTDYVLQCNTDPHNSRCHEWIPKVEK